MAATRFMRDLEIRLLDGKNSAAVDLFDLLHARKVLAGFGRAYGRLPDDLGEWTKDQHAFLDQAVAGLAQEGKVISVRLALFAEMVKGKPWTPATLKEVGGTEGVGVAFLEETFTASTAPPQHRLHQRAAQAVLKALLPESGTDMRGHIRSYRDLLVVSGYVNHPKEFADLIRILDSEIRLITPTDPEGTVGREHDSSPAQAGEQYYQLTHDYLVPSLLVWLTSMQRETKRGQAALLLADRAKVWNGRPTNRQLPSFLQWISILCLTQKEIWTKPQWKMMRKATRHHMMRGLLIAVIMGLAACWGSYEAIGRLRAHALRERLLHADTNEVPTIVQDMAPYRRLLDPLLREAYQEAEAKQEPRTQLNASLALLPVDAGQVSYLYDRLLHAEPQEVAVIRDALQPHKDELDDRLWSVVEQPTRAKKSQRLRAAAALAVYDPDSQRWTKVQDQVADDLVGVPAVYLAAWMDLMRPVRVKFLTPLSTVFRDAKRRETERSLATDILTDYAADRPQVLADLLMDADEKQFAVLYPTFQAHADRGLAVLQAEVARELSPDAKNDAKEKLAKRQANAAVVLLRMNHPERAWPLLRHSPDPRVRSYLIHRLAPMGADARAVVKRLDEEPDVTVRTALLLCLGQFDAEELTLAERTALFPTLVQMYQNDPDAGVHGEQSGCCVNGRRITDSRKSIRDWRQVRSRASDNGSSTVKARRWPSFLARLNS